MTLINLIFWRLFTSNDVHYDSKMTHEVMLTFVNWRQKKSIDINWYQLMSIDSIWRLLTLDVTNTILNDIFFKFKITYLELFSVRINKKKFKMYRNLIKYMLKYAKIINIHLCRHNFLFLILHNASQRQVTSCDVTFRHRRILWRHNSSPIVRWRKNYKWCYSVVK